MVKYRNEEEKTGWHMHNMILFRMIVDHSCYLAFCFIVLVLLCLAFVVVCLQLFCLVFLLVCFALF